MTGISQLPRCYGSAVAMATRVKNKNSFVLSHIESIIGMEVHWDNRHQPSTLVAMVTQLPWQPD